MLARLKTITTVTVKATRGQTVPGLSTLAAFKTSAGGKIIATRDIPAGRAYSFVVRQLHAITNYRFLEEADGTRYRVESVECFPPLEVRTSRFRPSER